MTSDQGQIKKAAATVEKEVKKQHQKDLNRVVKQGVEGGVMPKDVLGMSDQMVEGIYSQAYRLYNTGRYRDAGQLFRLLIMINSTEPKYIMGLAACFHMLKEYKNAIDTYSLCGIIDPDNPIPHYHASDCYIQLKDKFSAIIALEMAAKRAQDKHEYQTLRDRALMSIESLKKEIDKEKELKKE